VVVGARPSRLAKHFTPWINPIFKLAMTYLEPTRHDPILKRFPNAHEL
jgi:hypothetical protein